MEHQETTGPDEQQQQRNNEERSESHLGSPKPTFNLPQLIDRIRS
jgi:hypothetical protein